MAKPKANPDLTGESLSAYFRRLFKKHPKLLRAASSKPVMDDTENPARVKSVLYNVKSVLRGQKRRKQAQASVAALDAQAARQAPEIPNVSLPAGSTLNELEVLEEQIDECLALAKGLDRVMLDNVIQHLRLARNAVVLKQGQ
jgi:hypothetical protein